MVFSQKQSRAGFLSVSLSRSCQRVHSLPSAVKLNWLKQLTIQGFYLTPSLMNAWTIAALLSTDSKKADWQNSIPTHHE